MTQLNRQSLAYPGVNNICFLASEMHIHYSNELKRRQLVPDYHTKSLADLRYDQSLSRVSHSIHTEINPQHSLPQQTARIISPEVSLLMPSLPEMKLLLPPLPVIPNTLLNLPAQMTGKLNLIKCTLPIFLSSSSSSFIPHYILSLSFHPFHPLLSIQTRTTTFMLPFTSLARRPANQPSSGTASASQAPNLEVS